MTVRCSRCGEENYPLAYVPTPVSIVARSMRLGQWVCPDCLTDEEAGGAKARLLRLLKAHLSKPPKVETVLDEEYLHVLKAAAFWCPKGWRQEDCDGHSCPRRLDDSTVDYYDECISSLRARAVVEKIRQGRAVLVQGNASWGVELP